MHGEELQLRVELEIKLISSLSHGSSTGYVKAIEGKLHFEPQKGYMQRLHLNLLSVLVGEELQWGEDESQAAFVKPDLYSSFTLKFTFWYCCE